MTPDSPQTETGKRLLADESGWHGAYCSRRWDEPEPCNCGLVQVVAVIEQEARAAFAARLREVVEGLPWSRLTGEGITDGATVGTMFIDWDEYDDVVSKEAVLQAIEEASK